MPKLWSETIQEHRSAVHDAILDATARLVRLHGVTGLTMTALAETAGVGRATLYRYVPDTASAIGAWQQREISRHLGALRRIAAESTAEARLENVLGTYAHIRSHRHGGGPDAEQLHAQGRLAPATAELRELLVGIIADDAAAGRARADVPPEQLAAYAVAAIGAAAAMPDPGAVGRLVDLVLRSIRP
jgi:AcrR family transcriptional regulator